MTEVKKEGPKPMSKLSMARMKAENFIRKNYVATLAEGQTKEMLLQPAFWSHVAKILRPWDKVSVRAEDGSFYAELLVLNVQGLGVKMALMGHMDLNATDLVIENEEEAFEVKHKGPHKQWCVIRKADKQIVKEGCADQAAARTWMTSHVKALRA